MLPRSSDEYVVGIWRKVIRNRDEDAVSLLGFVRVSRARIGGEAENDVTRT